MTDANLSREDVRSAAGNAADSEGVNLWQYASVILRHRYLLLGLVVAAGAWSGTASLLSPRQYSAAASFVPQEAPAQTGLSQLASQFGLGTGRPVTASRQFYVELLQSREVLREVVNRSFRAEGDPPFAGNLVAYFQVTAPDRDQAVAKAVEQLRNVLTVRANPSTGIVRFDVHTRYPQLSLQVANQLLDLVNDYNLRRRQSQGRAEREFVEQRLGAAQRALEAAENAIAVFYTRNRRIADAPELVAEEQRLQRQVALRQQIYLALAQSHEAAKIEEVRNTPVITVVDHPEGFVEKVPRGTVKNAVIAVFGGALLGLVLAFALEYLKAARVAESRHYVEFVALWRRTLAELGGLVAFRRRAS